MEKRLAHKLISQALKARRRAVAPYSGFQVGAALLDSRGGIHLGANVESASFGLTCCAERVALFSALVTGRRSFLALAVVAAADGGAMPCGACRQLLAEYAPAAVVLVADARKPRTWRQFHAADLLPGAFRELPGTKGRRLKRPVKRLVEKGRSRR